MVIIILETITIGAVFAQFNSLQIDYSKLTREYEVLQSDYLKLKREAVSPPYTIISGRNVTWAFKLSTGELVKWEMPIDTYRAVISKTKPVGYLNLKGDTKTYRVMDYRPFVDSQSFSRVMPPLYYKINDDRKFIHEVWYIVAQLTIYSKEITETPRWALETLTEAGGDCEDTSILVASMLKAAPANYQVKLVYLDANNPTSPKTVNHVVVWVETGTYKTHIETTSKTVMNPYESVLGWYYEV